MKLLNTKLAAVIILTGWMLATIFVLASIAKAGECIINPPYKGITKINFTTPDKKGNSIVTSNLDSRGRTGDYVNDGVTLLVDSPSRGTILFFNFKYDNAGHGYIVTSERWEDTANDAVQPTDREIDRHPVSCK